MTSRERILERVREALQAKAPHPGAHEIAGTSAVPAGSGVNPREWLPAVGASDEERWSLFLSKATDLKATVHRVSGWAEANQTLAQLRDAEGWKRVGSHHGALAQPLAAGLGLPLTLVRAGLVPSELEGCDAGITECDALVAQTGSVLVTAASAGGRALSVLPPHHVVVARCDQLVPDLPEAFAVLKARYPGRYPSFISFITGPSRTGDIERILVLGAHGPKRLTILCLTDPALRGTV